MADSSDQYRNSLRGQERADAPEDLWKLKAPEYKFGRDRFRTTWIPHVGPQKVIDTNIETIDWDDSTFVMTGSIHMRDPSYGVPPDVGLGDEFMLEFSFGGGSNWVELWRMRVIEPYREFVGATRTLQLTNVFGWMAKSIDDFVYHNVLAHEVVLDIVKRYNVPVGTVAKGKHKIKRLVLMDKTPLDAIAEAYKRERRYTNRRFVLSAHYGKLSITPLIRNPRLLELGPTLYDAAFRQTLADEFATALTVRAIGKTVKTKDKKGHTRSAPQKIMVKVSSPIAIRQYGYVHKNVYAHDADTSAEAADAGLRHIVRVAPPQRELTLTHPGVPTLKRGDALRLLLADASLRQIVYITSAQHSLTGSDYQMTLGVTFTDPWMDAKLDSVDDQKETAAEKRGRRAKPKTKQKPKPKADTQPAKNGNRATKLTPGQRLTQRGHPR
jgi:hypothetical protein